ncbi:PP2C family protein-serine/threonine phosphatase [Synechocystis salina LEGE 06155]|nr:PP2C family protein-serine/threonine phosphatase [Synechocystis salina LEGE 06155]
MMFRPLSRAIEFAVYYPIRIVAAAIILTALLFVPLGWSAWQAYLIFQNTVVVDFQLQAQAGKIVHLDEVLTMSSQMAAATGNLAWEERYIKFEPELGEAIKQAIALAPEAYEGEGAKETEIANNRLVAMETEAFKLVRRGDLPQAQALLNNPEYLSNKQIYIAGIERSELAIANRIEANLANFRQTLFFASTLAVISLITLIPLWAVVLKALQLYMKDREIARQQILEANSQLEIKVAERTADLAKANEEITSLNDQLKKENMRLGTELDVARKLQMMVLPKHEELLEITDLDIACYMASATEVGGDYYDVIKVGNRIFISIGDVTGHGLESGVMAIMAQTAIQTLLTAEITEAVQFHNFLNQVLYKNTQRMELSKNMTLVMLDYQSGELILSGQHESIFVIRSDGTIEEIDTIDLGFPLALEKDITTFIARTQISLHPGDVVVLYTDGIPEAENTKKQFYGLERFQNVLITNHQLTALEISRAVVDDLTAYIGDGRVFDDITLVIFKKI